MHYIFLEDNSAFWAVFSCHFFHSVQMSFVVFMGRKCSDYMFCLCPFIQSFHCRHGKAYLFKKVYALGRAWASNGGGVEGEWRAKIMANLNGKILDGASNCLLSICYCILSITEQSKRDVCHDGLPADLNHLTLYGRVNVFAGEKEERMMITGLHTVADIFCVGCGSIVGWKYETAHEKSQKYKEGKSVLERFKVSGPDGSFYWANHEHHHIGGSDADDV
ncbi:hypothetical protein POTOM_036612 [Populus tomentosa]|uniref:Yippee domain-containing protein n=1 Tax=Populus tomentosa TaxID=118781 RepID=A0A8X7Z0J2_POPTO|nr:hypothetical protein POTOM_036612 [Populus tomentosa]